MGERRENPTVARDEISYLSTVLGSQNVMEQEKSYIRCWIGYYRAEENHPKVNRKIVQLQMQMLNVQGR